MTSPKDEATAKPLTDPGARCAKCGRVEGNFIHDEEYERGGHDFVGHAPPPSERVRCPKCGGNCSDYPDTERDCPECDGKGYVAPDKPASPAAEWGRALRHCPACGITERGPGTIHRQGCRFVAPAPAPTPERTLTREAVVQSLGAMGDPDWHLTESYRTLLLAHDAEMRSEIERLRRENDELRRQNRS